jgi:hypothetical protein
MHKIRNFHEGHSTIGEWQGSGRGTAWERHGMCESAFNMAGERYGMCESAFKMPLNTLRVAVLKVNATMPSGLRRIWRGLMNTVACKFENLHPYNNYYKLAV